MATDSIKELIGVSFYPVHSQVIWVEKIHESILLSLKTSYNCQVRSLISMMFYLNQEGKIKISAARVFNYICFALMLQFLGSNALNTRQTQAKHKYKPTQTSHKEFHW